MAFPNTLFAPDGEQHSTYTTQRYDIGTKLVLPDGRTYRFCEKSGTAATIGRVQQAEVPQANMDDLVVVTGAVNTRTVTYTNQTPTAIAANVLAFGYLMTELTPGEAFVYVIESHAAIPASTADSTITLAPMTNGIIVAMTTATRLVITKSLYRDVIIHPSPPTAVCVGVANRAIAADNFGWLQTGGMASVLTDGTLTIARSVMASDAVDGAVEVMALAEGTPNTQSDFQILGTCHEVAADTRFSPILLDIRGVS